MSKLQRKETQSFEAVRLFPEYQKSEKGGQMKSKNELSKAQKKILNDPLERNPLGFDQNLYPIVYRESISDGLPGLVVEPSITPVPNKLPGSVVEPSITPVPNKLPGFLKPVLASGNNAFTSIAPSVDVQDRLMAGVQTATINVTYHHYKPRARKAFEYAVSIWESLIVSSVPITVDAYWKPLAPGVLGSSGPNNFFRNYPGEQSNTWYPSALANKLAGQDLDSSHTDITCKLSSTFDWYLGTHGKTPANKVDFVTVVLQELSHGLGTGGLMEYSNGQGAWGYGTGYPSIYDRFTENRAGKSLINTNLFPNPSVALGNKLTSNKLFFDGTNAVAANNGTRPKLYAPSPWQPGSSYAHLDEATYPQGNPNSLNTPILNYAESIHNPGPITLGILKDMGWTIASPLPKIAIAKLTVNPSADTIKETSSGRGGNDILIGSGASDILSGGKGADTLTGGAGRDVFTFSTPSEGIDKITHFNPLEDLIQVSAAGFGGGLIAGETLSSAQFSLGSVTAATRFIFTAASGALYFDSDGSGGVDQIQLAKLTPDLALTNENIFVS